MALFGTDRARRFAQRITDKEMRPGEHEFNWIGEKALLADASTANGAVALCICFVETYRSVVIAL
ncbi:hypothetical protein D3C81_1726060 [compost metagenome]